jgi:hypothetical protein
LAFQFFPRQGLWTKIEIKNAQKSHDRISMELARRLRDISRADALESYEELKTPVKCANPGLSRVGIKALDYFFLGYRLRAKTRSHLSFADAMRDPERVAHLTELVRKYKAGTAIDFSDPDDLLRHQYSVFQLYYGTINQFRPSVAKWVYCTLAPRVGILDFSAGWGGRAIAAMAMGIPYVGIDANKGLQSAYKKMIASYAHDAPVTMIFKPSETVDFSQFAYDLVFTSPPYFMIEEYERMPEYGSKEGFLEKFFRPVVREAWRHLRVGGHMALNMPHEMYMAIRNDLPPVARRIQMPVSNRHPTNARRGRKLGTEKARHELIYVWKKTDTTNRKYISKTVRKKRL